MKTQVHPPMTSYGKKCLRVTSSNRLKAFALPLNDFLQDVNDNETTCMGFFVGTKHVKSRTINRKVHPILSQSGMNERTHNRHDAMREWEKTESSMLLI